MIEYGKLKVESQPRLNRGQKLKVTLKIKIIQFEVLLKDSWWTYGIKSLLY